MTDARTSERKLEREEEEEERRRRERDGGEGRESRVVKSVVPRPSGTRHEARVTAGESAGEAKAPTRLDAT